ncbi:MAG: AIR synthase family protein [bacterium]
MAGIPAGKIPAELLGKLLDRLRRSDPSVAVGPHVGEDAAVIDLGDRFLVAKTDPITFATDRIGWYLVHVNANDIACLGATSRWLLVTCLLPDGRTDPASVEALFEDIGAACAQLGITVCGGHTEVTVGLDRPILVGQLLGETAGHYFVDKRTMRPGDLLLLTKGIAIEGTSVIARERGHLLRTGLASDLLERAKRLLTEPGISVVEEAGIALRAGAGRVHGMHDPTEGGLAQALWELAARGAVGMRLEEERIPVLPETAAVCERLGLDPMGLLASGALLIAVDPAGACAVEKALSLAGIRSSRIGEIREAQEGVQRVGPDGVRPLPRFERDELVKVFENKERLPK